MLSGHVPMYCCLQVSRVLTERRLLQLLSEPAGHLQPSPFLVRLLGSFQDCECIHLVLEYVPGGTLHVAPLIITKESGGILNHKLLTTSTSELESAIVSKIEAQEAPQGHRRRETEKAGKNTLGPAPWGAESRLPITYCTQRGKGFCNFLASMTLHTCMTAPYHGSHLLHDGTLPWQSPAA